MRIRYGWELALAALLVIEIVAFGAINPRMLDLNMLLFSTSDFICIGIVALPLTMVIVSGGIDRLRLARCICLPEAPYCFPGWPERRGTKVLVDSRWRLQISLTWMCWDSPFR